VIWTAGLETRNRVVVYILVYPAILTLHYQVFYPSKPNEYLAWLFHYKRSGYNITWRNVEADLLGIVNCTSELKILVEGEHFTMSVSLSQRLVKYISEQGIHSLSFDVKLI